MKPLQVKRCLAYVWRRGAPARVPASRHFAIIGFARTVTLIADSAAHQAGLPAVRIVVKSPICPFSQPNEERLRRCFARLGVTDIATGGGALPADGPVCVVRGDWLFDDGLTVVLAGRRNFVLTVQREGRTNAVAACVTASAAADVVALLSDVAATFDAGAWRRLGLQMVDLEELGSVAYRGKLRNRVPPYVVPLDRMPLRDIEWLMFMASYKGVTDIITRYVWPRPAIVATRWCAAYGISPNAVTLVSFLCVVAATFLFATGWYWCGLLFAWSMCFLDTVDGKLARVTITSSKWGNVFDHGTDLVHPPFWWFAWYWGLQTLPYPPAAGVEVATAIVLAGYVLGRVQEGIFLWAFGIEMHVWQRLDSAFRGITARRNPNLILFTLGMLAGRPDWGLLLVAGWTVASFAFHCVRIGQAFIDRSRGRDIVSWLATEAAAGA